MSKYRLRLDWDDEFKDRETALEATRMIWEEVEGLSDGQATLQVLDVQALPRERPTIFDQEAEGVVLHTPPPFIPDEAEAGVTHPWDQGARFFPQGHPLYDFETVAMDHDRLYDEESRERQRAAFASVAKELPPGKR